MNLFKCSVCNENKEPSLFYKDKTSKRGFRSQCTPCIKEAKVFWNKYYSWSDLERQAYDEANREKMRRRASVWSSANPDKAKYTKKKAALKRYGLTPEEYVVILDRQGGGCKICGATAEAFSRSLHVDHDHKCCSSTPTCGKCTRGIVCHNCNVIMGHANDSIEKLRMIIVYLEN